MDPGTAMLVGGGLNLIGGLFGRKSAKKQKRAENAFYLKKWLEYDMPMWQMSKDKLIADHAYMTEGVLLKAANEKKFRDFQHQNNLRAYQQQLKIRSFQHEQQKRLFNKSERLYGESVKQAHEQAALQMRETRQSFAFQNEDRIIESIQKKGELAATSQAGRSAVKAAQSELYDQGRQVAIMTESLISADKNTRMGLRDFLRKADANRMLRPEAPPEPLKPVKAPLHDYQTPRPLQEFDFGPKPIKGVSFTQVPGFGSILAGAATAGFNAFAGATSGTNNFDYGAANSTKAFGSMTIPSSVSTGNYDLSWGNMNNSGLLN